MKNNTIELVGKTIAFSLIICHFDVFYQCVYRVLRMIPNRRYSRQSRMGCKFLDCLHVFFSFIGYIGVVFCRPEFGPTCSDSFTRTFTPLFRRQASRPCGATFLAAFSPQSYGGWIFLFRLSHD